MKSSFKMAESVAHYAVYYLAKLQPLEVDGLIDGQLKQSLNRILDELMTRNDDRFTALLTQLQLDEDNCTETLFNVFAEMLSDRAVNWGRLLTMYTFGGCAAKHLLEQGASKEVANRIVKTCADFATREFATWIEEQGGWENFSSYFGQQEKPELLTWNGWHNLFRVGINAISSAVSVR